MTNGEDYIWKPWFVQPNDLIGGHCIMAEDLPPSQSVREIADFVDEQHARHIVRLHNDYIRKHGSPEEGNNAEL